MAHNLSPFASLSSNIADLVAAAAPRVASITARHHRAASGLALGGDLILTADHVVEHDRDIGVAIGDARYTATVVGRDPATDLAVLRAADLNAPELRREPFRRVSASSLLWGALCARRAEWC